MGHHIRTVIQSGVFSKAEDRAFTNALRNYAHVPTDLNLIKYFYQYPVFGNSFFRGSTDALAQCPYPRAHTATPMPVFNWLYFAKYIPPEIFVNYDWQPIFGRDLPTSPLFIRSATGDKRLPGDVYTFDNKFEIEIAKSTFDNIRREHKNDILIIASPKKLQQEQRYVVYKDKVITGSEYVTRFGNRVDIHSSISDLSVADTLLKQSSLKQIIPLQEQPYTLDIAFVEGTPKILEINSFWCAGMYGCDIGKIISTLEQHHYFE